MATRGLIMDVSQLIADDINAMTKKQHKIRQSAVNTRGLTIDNRDIPNLIFTNNTMQDILNSALKYDITEEYISIVENYRANIIDPETGLSYFACNDSKIDNSIKKVSFINDKVYAMITQNYIKFKDLNINFNIRKFNETSYNLYYDISYMYNLLSHPGILRIPNDIGIQNPGFKNLIDFILSQFLLDLTRNSCKVIISDEIFDFLTPTNGESEQNYFDRVVTPNFQKIYDICFQKTNNSFITSKILFGVIMVFAQTFDALDNKIYENLELGITQEKEFIKTINIDIEKDVISWVKLFIPQVNLPPNSDTPFIIYSQSSILYKCYDYITDSIYTTNVLIIPKHNKLTITSAIPPELSQIIDKSGMAQIENFNMSKQKLDKKNKSENIGDIVLPNTNATMDTIKFANVKVKRGSNNSGENININLEFPSAWGNNDVFDFIISHQLINRKYLPAISPQKKESDTILSSISDLFITCYFEKDILQDIITQFFIEKKRNIKIIKSIITSPVSGLEYPVFFLIRNIIKKTGAVYNIMYYTSPLSLPSGDIFDLYTQIIKDLARIINKKQYYPVKYKIDTTKIIDNSIDADIRLLSLLSLFSVINGIISIGDRIAKPNIEINNFICFVSQLKLLLNNWHFFEKVKNKPNVVSRKLPESVKSTSTRSIRKTVGAKLVSRQQTQSSLNGGRKIRRKYTIKKYHKN